VTLYGCQIVTARSKNPGDSGDNESILEADSRWKLAGRAARSSALVRANQLRDILLFLVRKAILQPEEPVREFEIAHRILGRRSDFNPVDDNIVRVQMAHLRKKLDLYFSTEGKDEKVVITIALGNYKPIFSHRDKPPLGPLPVHETEISPRENDAGNVEGVAGAPVSNDSESTSKDPPSRRRSRWMFAGKVAVLLAIILTLAGSSVILWLRNRDLQQSVDAMRRALYPWRYQPAVAELWTGFFDSNPNTDIVLSDDSFLLDEQISKQAVPFDGYLSRSYIDQSQARATSPDTRFILGLIASKSLGNTGEFQLARRILELDPLGRNTRLYSARQYMPTLIKQDNVILIGGRISNPWVNLFESQLNFTENTRFEDFGISTVTNRAPAAGEQGTYIATNSVGYCVVAYLPNPDHTGKALLIEGTSAEATEAAGDFLFSEDRFSAFRKMLHPGSRLPYFEVLLKTSQVKGTPLTTTIETYRTHPNQN